MSTNIKIETLYVIIGFLNEYSNGYQLDPNIVDTFYVDELEKAKLFEKKCMLYLANTNQENDVQLIKNKSGLHELHSQNIAKILKQYYTIKNEYGLHNLPKENSLFQALNEENKTKKYSFLMGVALRQKVDGNTLLKFSNAINKVELSLSIFDEFKDLGFDNYQLKSIEGFPQVTEISFPSDAKLWQALKDYTN